KTDKNACACSGDLNFFIHLSRCLVSWCEFSAQYHKSPEVVKPLSRYTATAILSGIHHHWNRTVVVVDTVACIRPKSRPGAVNLTVFSVPSASALKGLATVPAVVAGS